MLWDKNIQILYRLPNSLTKTSLVELSLLGYQMANLSRLHQVFIYGTHALPQLYQLWTQLQGELAYKRPY